MPSRSAASRSGHAELREAMLDAAMRLWSNDLIVATEGNLSVRLGDGQLLVTPATRRKWELEPDDLVVVGAPPGAPAGGASSDIRIHRAIYAARPDVMAVVHAHVPASMGLTLAGEAPDPAALPETALFLPRLPLIPFADPGSPALAAAIGQAFCSEPAPLPNAVLLERHGAVAVGAGAALAALPQAIDRLELVEVLSRAWRDALLVGAATGRDWRAILRGPRPGPGSPAGGGSRRAR